MTATQPTRPRTEPRRRAPRALAAVLRHPTLAAALGCLVSFTAFWIAQRAAHVTMLDLMVYRAEGETVVAGRELYEMRATSARLPNTYPPFASLLFVPLTLPGVGTLRTLATLGNLLLLVALVHLSLRLIGLPRRVPRPAAVLALSALVVWCEPVWTTLRYGQVNLLIAVLVCWDLSRRSGHRWAGLGIGLAAGIKLTPALFAVLLALTGALETLRRLRAGRTGADARTGPGTPADTRTEPGTPADDRTEPETPADDRTGRSGGPARAPSALRTAAVATAAFLGTVLVAWAALPRDSHRFWIEVIFATERVGLAEQTANQSLRGVLARLLHTGDPAPWAVTALAVTVAALGLAIAPAAALAGPGRLPGAPAWSAVTCAVTALLVSPISWSHHWVWCVPLLLLLGGEAVRRSRRSWWAATAGAGLLFCSFALWWVPHPFGERLELHQNGGQMLLSAVYPLAGVAFLALAGATVTRALRPGPRRVPDRRPDRGRGPRHDGDPRRDGGPRCDGGTSAPRRA
ncbi:glycosyltransferase 87 family protein [Streptomyces sp. URMC 123]|uniref:glycosyltransferase 87 family protein n=1 Tax=Streptomyces sp. URMC 123 TaxID=3423403 RepID=UPI003F1C5EC8